MAVAVRMGERPRPGSKRDAMWLAVSGGNDHNIIVFAVVERVLLATIQAHQDCIGAIEFLRCVTASSSVHGRSCAIRASFLLLTLAGFNEKSLKFNPYEDHCAEFLRPCPH